MRTHKKKPWFPSQGFSMVAELAIVLVVLACGVTNFLMGIRQLIARKIESG